MPETPKLADIRRNQPTTPTSETETREGKERAEGKNKLGRVAFSTFGTFGRLFFNCENLSPEQDFCLPLFLSALVKVAGGQQRKVQVCEADERQLRRGVEVVVSARRKQHRDRKA